MYIPLLYAGDFAFSIYTLLLLGTAVTAVALGVNVMVRDEGSRISLWFFGLTATMGWWLFGRAMISAAVAPAEALIWARFSYVAFPFLPAAFLQFTYHAIGRERKPLVLLVATWAVGAVSAVLSLTSDRIIDGLNHYPWGFYPRYGPVGALVIASFVIIGALDFYVLGATIRRLPSGRRRSRLVWFTAGTAIGFLGTADFVAAYGVPLVPFGHFAAIGLLVVLGMGIRKFQLFDLTPAFASTNIVSTMQDGLIVTDDEGHVRIVNDSLCRLTGYERENLLAMTDAELIAVPNLERATLRSRGGTLIPISVSVSPLKDRGHRVGTVFIAHDMREQRRIESAMLEQQIRLRTEEVRRKAELQYRTLVESMSEGIVQVDGNGVVRYINDRAAEMLGCIPGDVIGQEVASVFDDGRSDAFVRALTEPAGTRVQVELDRDGVSRWLEILCSPMVEPSGDTVGSISVLADVTDRRLFEQQLAMSEKEWRETFDAMPMPVVVVDGAGIVQRANRAAREYAAGPRLPVAVAELGRSSLWREVERLVHSVNESAQVQFFEADTGATWDIVVDVRADERHEKQIIVAARDITAFVELQTSLRHSETMSALGALVGGVAHEVRNPLFAISSTLDAFERIHGDRPELRRFLGVLRDQIARLSDLMSGLLELGRPVAPAAFVPTSLDSILEEALALCIDEASEMGVTISYQPDPSLPKVDADERRLLQAFRNVVHNAVQHSPKGGTVTVRVERSELASGAKALLCEVADQGGGFDPADVPHVFDSFFTHRSGGTGLGLSITRAVIEQHLGTVSVGNRLEGGAIVSITLPVAQSTVPQPSSVPSPRQAGRGD